MRKVSVNLPNDTLFWYYCHLTKEKKNSLRLMSDMYNFFLFANNWSCEGRVFTLGIFSCYSKRYLIASVHWQVFYFMFNCKLRVKGFVKIARIGTVTIPDRQKTVRTASWWYLHDTGIILVAILDTRFVMYC